MTTSPRHRSRVMTGTAPAGRDEQVVLADGKQATIRRLLAADRPHLQALFDAVNEEHLYTRFFTCGRHVVTTQLDHLFAGEPDVVTYVVDLAGRLVGVCDVERLSSSTAEIAFLVADDVHGNGVGTLLLERAARDARLTGVEWFVSDVLARNREMIRVFTDVGFVVELVRDGSDVGVRMSTTPGGAALAAERLRHDTALAQLAARDQPTAVPKSRPIA